ncbi:DUF6320 domain-containing protein [Paratissierella segnis]|jgi:hypothetical protein|uniref:Zinc ribbon domain-containing protein n=1 Tax=Paratissierella segnis TaxID=2763679 RepID=A0A926EUS0_9FIRM|nr:DUF6320 domain-containing protein [Paratissierella segnis]MBC8586834.1 hypothetical protein [Paratissierella segnis]
MKSCSYCNVNIRGNREKCPLCGNPLPYGDAENIEDEIFPSIPPFYESHLAIRIMVFISIVSIVVSFAINIIFPSKVNWPLLFLFGIISVWLGLYAILQKRYHIPKKIVWQAVIISLLSVFWDWRMGWRGWSLNYVIPIACISATIIMYVTAKILNLSVRDYITYSLIDSIFGIIPLIFIVFGWVDVIYPSIISIALSIISLSAILIFQGTDIKAEMDKRMHI